jgi:hypothetical protein
MNKPMSTRDIADAVNQNPSPPHPAEPHLEHATDRAPLFNDDEGGGFRSRWEAVQTGFVDEPRTAVEQADALVAEVMKRLAEVFANERTTLEHQWGRGDNVSTEELRIALKKYRSFFERLLTV